MTPRLPAQISRLKPQHTHSLQSCAPEKWGPPMRRTPAGAGARGPSAQCMGAGTQLGPRTGVRRGGEHPGTYGAGVLEQLGWAPSNKNRGMDNELSQTGASA